VHLHVEIDVRSAYRGDEVVEAVDRRLIGGPDALLAPEQLGVGGPLYRSRLFDAIMAVDGVDTVTALGVEFDGERDVSSDVDHNRFDDHVLGVAGDAFLDFESGRVDVTRTTNRGE
jgi:hypothetical protein